MYLSYVEIGLKMPITFFSEEALSHLIAKSTTGAKMPYKGNRFHK